MGRVGIAAVTLALLGVVYLQGVEPGSLDIPGLSAAAAPEPPAHMELIGTAAPVALPETDVAAWFADDPEADPYDPSRWREIDSVVGEAFTQAGWSAVCAAATEATGAAREDEPLAGALACSSVAAVTELQETAARVLLVQASVALWIRGAPGYGAGTIEARQAAVRHACEVGVVARDGTVPAEACALALDAAWRDGDAPATFEAAGEAYALLAEAIAARDGETAPEPAFYETAGPPGTDVAESAGAAEDTAEP